MKVEIDIDLDKIDYDSINDQIVERVKNMTPSEIFRKISGNPRPFNDRDESVI